MEKQCVGTKQPGATLSLPAQAVKKPAGRPPPNRARRRVRRARFFRSESVGKTIPSVRKSPGKSGDFQISAGFLLIHENPRIFMERVKIPLTRNRTDASPPGRFGIFRLSGVMRPAPSRTWSCGRCRCCHSCPERFPRPRPWRTQGEEVRCAHRRCSRCRLCC